MRKENILTGEKFNIIGRGLVLICLNCTKSVGESITHKGVEYEITGIETMGGQMHRVGLLVKVKKHTIEWVVFPKFIKPVKKWKPNLIQRLLIRLRVINNRRFKPEAWVTDEWGKCSHKTN